MVLVNLLILCNSQVKTIYSVVDMVNLGMQLPWDISSNFNESGFFFKADSSFSLPGSWDFIMVT